VPSCRSLHWTRKSCAMVRTGTTLRGGTIHQVTVRTLVSIIWPVDRVSFIISCFTDSSLKRLQTSKL
jgi:hypothetical protein